MPVTWAMPHRLTWTMPHRLTWARPHRLSWATLLFITFPVFAATTQERYYAHEAVEDAHGVIAPWYQGANGQVDWRVRIAAETLKRYPWSDASNSPRPLPHYMWSGKWKIDKEGTITIPPLDDWANGDLGQRAAYVLAGWVDYYRYTGDPTAIAHMSLQADMLLDFCLTPDDHPWPRFLISVPVHGKPYGQADPRGYIQLDNTAEAGIPLIKAAQIVSGKQGARWMAAAQRWGDLLAEKRDRRPGMPPWGRYANPQDVPWEDNMTGNVVFLLEFFDTLIAAGYHGYADAIIEARKAGVAYLQDLLDRKWLVHDTWGRNFWDWNAPVQLENVTEFVARYVMEHPDEFPNWRNDARNILTLFLHRTSASPKSAADTFSGAWAYPESSGCCGRSLWYGPMEIAPMFAQLGAMAADPLMAELGRRQMILATYDAHETGVVEDNIDGGQIVAGDWFKIAHPMALKHCLNMIAWQPEVFAPPGENHIVRSTGTVTGVTYRRGGVHFRISAISGPCTTILRLTDKPRSIRAWPPDPSAVFIELAEGNASPGYRITRCANGDCIVTIQHPGLHSVLVQTEDPFMNVEDEQLQYSGNWEQIDAHSISYWPHSGDNIHRSDREGAITSFRFTGSSVSVIGSADVDGGLADVYLDGQKQPVGIDCWSPRPVYHGTLFYRNGLKQGEHSLDIIVRGAKNPSSRDEQILIDAVRYSRADDQHPASVVTRIPGPQRWIFGYPERTDYVDTEGNAWRPATEWVVRAGHLVDSVAANWWTSRRCHVVENTRDPELYRYGAHGKEFWANFTVSPGTYHVRLKFAETRNIEPRLRAMDVEINGREVVRGFDIAATAAGGVSGRTESPNRGNMRWSGLGRAVDLVFNGIEPRNGMICIRFSGTHDGEAIVQAIEVGPGDGGKGATPATAPATGQAP